MTSVPFTRALAPGVRRHGLGLGIHGFLTGGSAFAGLLQVPAWLGGQTSAGPSILFMLGLATVFGSAAVARRLGRTDIGAVLTTLALLAAVAIAQLLYPPSPINLLVPVIAFLVALPAARGRTLALVAGACLLTEVAAGIPAHFWTVPLADRAVIAMSVALVPALVMLMAWRTHRSALTSAREADDVRSRLSSLVEHAADAITTRDIDGTIVTWNSGAERLFGWSAEEAIGRHASFIVDRDELESFHGMHEQVLAGNRVGPFEVARRARSGERLVISIVNSPIRDADGTVVGVASIGRDVTEERRLEARLERWRTDRAMVIDALEGLHAAGSVEGTASAICAEVARAGFRDVALVGWTDPTGTSLLGAHGDRDWAAWIALGSLDRLRGLRVGAGAGIWGSDVRTFLPDGLPAMAHAPVVHAGTEIGLLVVGDPMMGGEDLRERLPGLVELGAVAAPLIGPDLAAHHERARMRDRVRRVIDERAFHTVYQPIVHMDVDQVLGYEALTRFDDGTAPDRMFADAHRVGLGLELEAVTLRTALESAGPLPANRFLDLNVSPELILAGEPLRSMVDSFGFGTVLEITEHSAVPDYAAFREAIGRIRGVRLAVDDAGAGFSSLRHIIELRPQLIKLDRAVTAGIDGDPVREALVAGMVHFADRIDAHLVAEGVETAAERAALLKAGIRMGQGYLLGRPQRIEALDATASHPAEVAEPGRSAVRDAGTSVASLGFAP